MENIIVVGASGGIGQSLIELLLAKNYNVIAVSRNLDKLKKLQEKFNLDPRVCETKDFNSFAELCKKLADQYQNLHGIVNLAGSLFLKPAHLTTQNDFTNIIEDNLQTGFSVVRAAGEYLSKNGSVVLLSSSAALVGIANHELIAAAKSGLSGLAKAASATYLNKKIRFNVVAPGMTTTPLTEKLLSNDLALQASITMHPLGRLGKPFDIASLITWLLDPENSWITGQTIAIDGGLANIRTKIKS